MKKIATIIVATLVITLASSCSEDNTFNSAMPDIEKEEPQKFPSNPTHGVDELLSSVPAPDAE